MVAELISEPQTDKNLAEIQRVFDLQKQHQYDMSATSAQQRVARLRAFEEVFMRYRDRLAEAMLTDLKKPAIEVDITEIYPVVREIKTATTHIHRWMAPQSVATTIALLGTSSEVHHVSKGVVLIIAPWNYPINLLFYPLVSAIAAGNCVILKPSELAPKTAAVMAELIREAFDEREVAIFEGDAETAKALLRLPFNHVFFTGSPAIGKVVMQAAAVNLTSVTLELGGKSPVIIDQTANLNDAVGKICAAKFINAGQTCIAPDYVLIHESIEAAFVEKMKAHIAKGYGNDPKISESLARIVNSRHTGRIKNLLDEAVSMGANVVCGGPTDLDENYIAPTILTKVPVDAAIMSEEIFGPVLPIVTYRTLDEAIQFVQAKHPPLALYIFSSNRKNKKNILANTQSGDVCINDCALHFLNDNLPFGGHNNSGIGKGHGEAGFKAFSHSRGVLRQQTILNVFRIFYPPYTNFARRLFNLVIKLKL